MSLSIERFDTGILAQEAAKKVNALLAEYKNLPVLFLSAGGSSLKILPHIDTNLFDQRITFSVTDERYIHDPAHSNFAQVAATPFYSTVVNQGSHMVNTHVEEGETLEELGKQFESSLKEWKSSSADGRIIITQGMGPDGHTQGIMPYPENPELFSELFNNPEHWVAAYDATKEKNEFPLRVTITLLFLRDIVDHSIAFISGENKKPALERALSESGSLAETPARIMQEMKDASVFTDVQL